MVREIRVLPKTLAEMSADVLECEAIQVEGVSYEQGPSGNISSCRRFIDV